MTTPTRAKKICVYVPPALYGELLTEAQRDRRDLSAYVRMLLEGSIDRPTKYTAQRLGPAT